VITSSRVVQALTKSASPFHAREKNSATLVVQGNSVSGYEVSTSSPLIERECLRLCGCDGINTIREHILSEASRYM